MLLTSLPGHTLRFDLLHFLGFLHERAEGAEEPHDAVPGKAALDALAVPDLAAVEGPQDLVDPGHQEGQATQQAVLSHRLRVPSELVARDEVGNDAQAAVVETAAQSVLPLVRHGWSSVLVGFVLFLRVEIALI